MCQSGANQSVSVHGRIRNFSFQWGGGADQYMSTVDSAIKLLARDRAAECLVSVSNGFIYILTLLLGYNNEIVWCAATCK